MSDKESLRRRITKAVFIKAWKMHKQGSKWINSFGISLKVAWQIVRCKISMKHTKVVGVTFNNSDGISRQRILRRLSGIPEGEIAIYFKREPDNVVDPNAIKVIAYIANKASIVLGYVNRNTAAIIAGELDFGALPYVLLEGVTGVGSNALGCNIAYTIIDMDEI